MTNAFLLSPNPGDRLLVRVCGHAICGWFESFDQPDYDGFCVEVPFRKPWLLINAFNSWRLFCRDYDRDLRNVSWKWFPRRLEVDNFPGDAVDTINSSLPF